MSQSDPIDFWFYIGSMYTFLTVMRIDRVEDTTDVRFVWRPFSVRTIMIEMDNRPISKPVKLEYMWRDLQRRAEMYGFAFEGKAPYPLPNGELANRVAIVGAREGWCADYVRATYRRWFIEKQEPGGEPNLSDSLREIGQDPARVIALAEQHEAHDAYTAATDAARRLGIFGAPTFVTRGEAFWGDDRLEDAVTWAQRGTLGAPRAP
jgi:2-hydroxychromene-2-carboxylate isomerase